MVLSPHPPRSSAPSPEEKAFTFHCSSLTVIRAFDNRRTHIVNPLHIRTVEDVCPYRFCGIFIVLNNKRMYGGNRNDLGSSGRRPLQVLWCFYCFGNIRLRGVNRCDLGLSARSASTDVSFFFNPRPISKPNTKKSAKLFTKQKIYDIIISTKYKEVRDVNSGIGRDVS